MRKSELYIKLVVVVCWMTLATNLTAQEYIQNGGLEVGQVPSAPGKLDRAMGWSQGNIGPGVCHPYTTPDLFDYNAPCSVDVPNNKWSPNRPAFEGGHYLGLATGSSLREVAYATIKQALVAGCYNLSFI